MHLPLYKEIVAQSVSQEFENIIKFWIMHVL